MNFKKLKSHICTAYFMKYGIAHLIPYLKNDLYDNIKKNDIIVI